MKFHQVNPSDVIILEGILIFHDPRVRDLMNMKIFVDTGSFLPFLVLKFIVFCNLQASHVWLVALCQTVSLAS